MSIPEELLYTETHEWIKADDVATVGVTDFAQQQLGDVTFVDLPEEGETISQQDAVAVIESVKAASDIYSPLSGEIVEVNEALEENPERVNSDPYGEGWLYKIKVSDKSELDALMDSAKYKELQAE